jgi:Xaa-Pro aminopeptidase
MKEKISQIQQCLREHAIDGWLLYDNHGSNRFVREILEVPVTTILSRRFFYWIPQQGDPIKLLHRIEAEALDFLPGERKLYLSWNELNDQLKSILASSKKVIMEYSPKNQNPYVSVVDAGTIELVKEAGVEVLSSSDLLQHFTSVLDDKQIECHFEASKVVTQTAIRAWDLIGDRLRSNKPINEYDVQKFILSEFSANNCITTVGPICACGENSALPHYVATKHHAKPIVKGDFVLIDLSCKKNVPHGIYADITRVAVVATEPTPMQEEIFEIVKRAQEAASTFIIEGIEGGKVVYGYEVDVVSRNIIEEAGYGSYFTHRTGHNIDSEVHGAGAHLDNLEMKEERTLLPGTLYSIEPGIYLPGNFGLRLEYNLLIRPNRQVIITGEKEEKVFCII